MTVTINGTTGIAGVDGTASSPAIQGNDTNTGIFFPAADTIAFAEGGVEVARFDSSGRFTVPNQPCFSGYYNGTALGPSNVPAKLTLTAVTNNGSYYSSGNFTAPVAGYYYCTFIGATIYGTLGALDISIRKNGSMVANAYAYSSNANEYNAGSCTAVVYCATNDTIEFWKNGSSTNSLESGISFNSASIMLIG